MEPALAGGHALTGGRNFERPAERWRDLYLSALKQQEAQNAIVLDASRRPSDKKRRSDSEPKPRQQLSLLTEVENVAQSDFYSYRYFASEGFLPGYSFPRLPLSAYIPGRNRKQRDEFLSRPRFLAISEFGPRSIIYHEGARYEINKAILPVGDHEEGNELFSRRAKICPHCGYLHPLTGGASYDTCERCEGELEGLYRTSSDCRTSRRAGANASPAMKKSGSGWGTKYAPVSGSRTTAPDRPSAPPR